MNKNNKKAVNEDDDIDNLFSEIEGAEENKTRQALQGYTADPSILSLKKNNHTVRGVFLPYKPKPANTFVTYEKIGFYSESEKRYIDLGVSPKSRGVRNDPVNETQWKLYSEGKEEKNEAKMKKSYKLLPSRTELVNFYIIDDSANPDNNGTVKVLRYGASINKEGKPMSALYSKIREAIFGDKKDKIGQKAFLTKKFSVFRPFEIKVKEKGGYANYDDSSFDDSEEHGFTPEEIDEIHAMCYDLETYIPELKSNEELKQLLNEYWFVTDVAQSDIEEDDVDEDDFEPKKEKEKPVTLKKTLKEKMAEKKAAPKDETDEMLDDIDTDDLDFSLDDD